METNLLSKEKKIKGFTLKLKLKLLFYVADNNTNFSLYTGALYFDLNSAFQLINSSCLHPSLIVEIPYCITTVKTKLYEIKKYNFVKECNATMGLSQASIVQLTVEKNETHIYCLSRCANGKNCGNGSRIFYWTNAQLKEGDFFYNSTGYLDKVSNNTYYNLPANFWISNFNSHV